MLVVGEAGGEERKDGASGEAGGVDGEADFERSRLRMRILIPFRVPLESDLQPSSKGKSIFPKSGGSSADDRMDTAGSSPSSTTSTLGSEWRVGGVVKRVESLDTVGRVRLGEDGTVIGLLAGISSRRAVPKTDNLRLVKRDFDLLGDWPLEREEREEGSTVLERLKRAKTVFFLWGGAGVKKRKGDFALDLDLVDFESEPAREGDLEREGRWEGDSGGRKTSLIGERERSG